MHAVNAMPQAAPRFGAMFWALLIVCAAPAQTPDMQPGPKSPQESLKCIQVRPGFTVELMAAEPLVMDPIAFAWGADGKFWVVEMGDYPLGVDGKNKPGGRVKFLEKASGGRQPPDDEPYTKATLFLDNLGYPTGVTPWGKGVLITCAPDIFYAEDTDGDGKADKKEVLFTGFREGNQQHRVNGLVWGLDNWLYGANGDSGGVVKSLKTGKEVNISGRDFRLKPDTGEFEAVTGQTQFGRCRDDWGNWFGNNNSNPLFHFVLEDRYLKRNPHVLYPDPRVNVSVQPGASPVYPISKPLPRFNDSARLNHITSACSPIIYRDDLFGAEFIGNSFVSEPVHNLIHREIVKPKGVTFTSQRADDEQTSEFLASSDNWFRPTTIAVGPDGALWIADMYRYVIEHPEWIPRDWQKKLDLRGGHDKGRIYRVYPKDKKPREIPRMDKLNLKELVQALESPSGWVRDTAQQQLIGLRGTEAAERALRLTLLDVLSAAPSRRTYVHALATLQGVDRLTSAEALAALEHDDLWVRRMALQLFDENDRDFTNRLAKLIGDPSPAVRLQLAVTLGSWRNPLAGDLLGRLLAKNGDDRFIAAAIFSSVNKANCDGFLIRLGAQESIPSQALPTVIRIAQAHGATRQLGNLMLRHYAASPEQEVTSDHLLHVAGLLDAAGSDPEKLLKSLHQGDPLSGAKMSRFLERAHSEALRLARDAKTPAGDRLLALRLLGRGLGSLEDDWRVLREHMGPQWPEDVQAAAAQQLGTMFDPRVPRLLTANWKSYSPILRGRVLDILLGRTEWTPALIEELEQKRIIGAEIDAVRRQRLLDHRDFDVRRLAAKILAASSDPDRAKLVSRYWISLPARADAKHGAKLFEKHCGACHQLGGIGQQVGPELAAVGDKSPEGLLSAILDPNRAVEARYVNYLASTKAGLTVSGLLQGETSTTITLVTADGKKHDLLRKEIDELTSTGKSVMPEGFEKDLPPPDMADLIAFLRGHLAKPKSFAGNRPEVVKAGSDGSFKLAAASAAIYGKTLIFEDKFQNLGYWSSADDQAVWTIEVPKAGRFEVWVDYACDPGAAGNALAVSAPGAKLIWKVGSTASWELYRRIKIGTLSLPAGRHEIVVRAEGDIRGALIDLRTLDLQRSE